ncbi:glycosyl transferase group 1 [Rhodopseudomonas palustris TIE-1]|uniref:glycosyltransferase family 4 protein n=1 Tax=Rhodopseudomonas palustris TaxID=1076 RepID=UPI0001779845|nr:glycosyltransferase family 4 protein [Rhodopseudomonas palustris]ACF03071.1 glycosyl transferase group 1 [Rhodopseudomonas palustris TIE-1]
MTVNRMDENSRSLSILIVSQYFFPENFGINAIAAELAQRGHRVTVLTGMPNYPSGEFFPGYGGVGIRRETYESVDVIRVPLLARGRNSRLKLALNYLSFAISAGLFAPVLVRRRPDVILVYQLSPAILALPAMILRMIGGTRLLLWVQDLWPESLTATGMIRSQAILAALRAFVRRMYRASSIIAVQSVRFIDFIRPLAPANADIRYLPNTADALYRPTEVAADDPSRRLFKPGFNILFAGNLGLAQDLENVIEAIDRLKARREIRWTFAGDGVRRGWLEQQIAARGLADNVQVIGPFPPEQMPKLFAIADALLLSLRDDPIFSLTVPSKLQSYLACGRPVLASISGEAAEILKASGAGFAARPGDADGLAGIVTALADSSPAQRQAMARAALDYHLREYDREVWIGRLESWLLELAPP